MPPFESNYAIGVSYTAIPITASDSTDIAGGPVRTVDVLTGGNVSFTDARGQTVSLTGVPAGYAIKCVVRRINATGTTASGFIGYP